MQLKQYEVDCCTTSQHRWNDGVFAAFNIHLYHCNMLSLVPQFLENTREIRDRLPLVEHHICFMQLFPELRKWNIFLECMYLAVRIPFFHFEVKTYLTVHTQRIDQTFLIGSRYSL